MAGKGSRAWIGLCRARPADRSLVAEDWSAEGVRDRRDRPPRCSRGCSRDAPRHPGTSEYGTGRRFNILPARRPLQRPRQHRPRHRGHLDTDVPAAALATVNDAGEQLLKGNGVSLDAGRACEGG